MRILISDQGKIPALRYGGTERVIWYLGRELSRLGHEVTFLTAEGSECPFARVIALDPAKHPFEQIPAGIELAHFHFPVSGDCPVPVVFTNHGNRNSFEPFHRNTVFVSANHASRFGSDTYVHNGLDWDDYGLPDFSVDKKHFHFLGNAAWRVKNLKGAIEIIRGTKEETLAVLGGYRINLRMGLRITLSPRIRFYGMVGGSRKLELIRASRGLIFPVRWHEPFGLAIIESLYLGCPVFGTPYGSLPELVPADCGFLSARCADLRKAVENYSEYQPRRCHQFAAEHFHSAGMARNYEKLYEKVLSGQMLNPANPVLTETVPKYLPWN